MLFTFALLLFAVWFLGLFGVYQIGDLFHVFLLVGLLVLILAFLHAREAAVRRVAGESRQD